MRQPEQPAVTSRPGPGGGGGGPCRSPAGAASSSPPGTTRPSSPSATAGPRAGRTNRVEGIDGRTAAPHPMQLARGPLCTRIDDALTARVKIDGRRPVTTGCGRRDDRPAESARRMRIDLAETARRVGVAPSETTHRIRVDRCCAVAARRVRVERVQGGDDRDRGRRRAVLTALHRLGRQPQSRSSCLSPGPPPPSTAQRREDRGECGVPVEGVPPVDGVGAVGLDEAFRSPPVRRRTLRPPSAEVCRMLRPAVRRPAPHARPLRHAVPLSIRALATHNGDTRTGKRPRRNHYRPRARLPSDRVDSARRTARIRTSRPPRSTWTAAALTRPVAGTATPVPDRGPPVGSAGHSPYPNRVRSTCRPGRRTAASTCATSRHRRHRLHRRSAGPATPGRGRRRALPGRATPRSCATSRGPATPRWSRGDLLDRGRRAARLRGRRRRVLPRPLAGRPRLRGDRPPRPRRSFAAGGPRRPGVRAHRLPRRPAPRRRTLSRAPARRAPRSARSCWQPACPTAVLQAAVVLGSGSASFEMLRYLTERLPVMVTPRWVGNRIQPIAVRDVLRYLVAAGRAARGRQPHLRHRRPRRAHLPRDDAALRRRRRAAARA